MQKNKGRRIITLALLFILIILCVFIVTYNFTTNQSESHRSVQTSKNVLERNLTQATTLGGNKLTESKRNKLLKLNAKLSKDGFFGSYIGLKNSDLEFSSKIGYAHVGTKDIFRLNTTYFIGEYQNAINAAILLNLVNQNKLALSQSLEHYLPSLNIGESVTIKDLILGETGATINSGWYSQYLRTKPSNVSLKKVSLRSESTKYVSANSLITKILVSKVSGKSYAEVVTNEMQDKLGLSNTRVVTNDDSSQVNDAVGYQYYTDTAKKVVQGKAVDTSDIPAYNYFVRMSLVDVTLLTDDIQENKLVPAKYTKLYKRSLQNIDGFSTKDDGWVLKTETRGQYLVIRTNNNSSKMLILTSNIENRKVNISKLNTTLYDYLD